MYQNIHICRRENGKLTALKTNKLFSEFDDSRMDVFTDYEGEEYIVEGNCFYPYIVIR